MVSKINIFIFNHSDEKTSNKLEEIIDLIKKAKKDISKKNNNNIDINEFIFGDEMDDEYFLLLFKN